MKDADVVYYPNFFNSEKADYYFKSLLKNIKWQQDTITLFGKTHLQPRLTALYGNNNKAYTYSNIKMIPNTFIKELLDIKHTIEDSTKIEFTTCLTNLYRNGQNSNGWHSDDEKELGINPCITSVTFGEERQFNFKYKFDKTLKQKLNLKHGSLLLMKGQTQKFWLHQLPKTKKQIGERINLTFRVIA